MSEEWRAIPGYPDYEASSEGRIRSWKSSGKAGIRRNTPRILKGSVNNGGYIMYSLLHEDGSRAPIGGHRLAALAFHGPCPDGMWTLHINGNPSDNRPVNVRYGSPEDNSADACLHKAHPDGILEGMYWDHDTHELAQRLAKSRHLHLGQFVRMLVLEQARREQAAEKLAYWFKATREHFQNAANNLEILLDFEKWSRFANIPEPPCKAPTEADRPGSYVTAQIPDLPQGE